MTRTYRELEALYRDARSALRGQLGRVSLQVEVDEVRVGPSGQLLLGLRSGPQHLAGVVAPDLRPRLRLRPRPGDRAVVEGTLDVSPRGSLRLRVLDLRGEDDGPLGGSDPDDVMAPRLRRPLPRDPQLVGVAADLDGRPYQDFLAVWLDGASRRKVEPHGMRPRDPASVLRAVDRLVAKGAEVVVVLDSALTTDDLTPWDDAALARGLAAAPVPVVTALGHPHRRTAADRVADQACRSATVAARAVIAAAEDKGQQAAAPDRRRIPWRALVLALALSVGLGWLAWQLARGHVTTGPADAPPPEEPAAEPLPIP